MHDLPARGLRNGPRARDQQQGRSGVQARRPVRETAPTDAGLGEVLRRLEAIRGRCVDLASKGLTWLLMLSTDGPSTSTGLQIEERIEAPRVPAHAMICPERRFRWAATGPRDNAPTIQHFCRICAVSRSQLQYFRSRDAGRMQSKCSIRSADAEASAMKTPFGR